MKYLTDTYVEFLHRLRIYYHFTWLFLLLGLYLRVIITEQNVLKNLGSAPRFYRQFVDFVRVTFTYKVNSRRFF